MKKDELSTADRKLLSSLRRNLSAQQSQFVMKNGKKHHRFPPREVPYPQSYERLVLDHEMWEALFYQQLIGGVCIHQYEKPPAKALDLGCGTGAWILHAARVWKQTHFVGLDIVPLQPNLKRVGPSDLARRVTWVHANFLEKLPFPDDEFDFVMIKRIARAVPEDKSDALFEELYRVMKPGAIIELIEEDLYFPGSVTDPVIYASDDPSSAVSGPSSSSRLRSSSNASTYSLGSHQASPVSAAPPVPSFTQRRAKKLSDPTEHIPTSMVGPSRAHASTSAPGVARTRSGSIPPVPGSGADGNPAADGQKAQGSHPDTSPVLPHHEQNIPDSSSSAHLSPSQMPPVTTSPSNRRSGFFGGHSLLRRKSHSRGKGSSPTTHSQAAFQLMEAYTRGRSYTETMPPSTFATVNMLGSTPPTHTITLPAIDTSTDTIAIDISKSPIEPPASASVGGSSEKSEKRSLSAEEGADDKGRMSGEPEPRPSLGSLFHADHPVLSANPRDHSLLERIYREMHAERFINLTPLSLLPAQLDRYFSHVQSNAPISFAFPPRTQRRSTAAVEDGAQVDLLDPASIVRLQHSKINASPSRPGSLQQRSRHPSFSFADDSGPATSVLSQYILVDSARMPAVHARPRPHISTESINSTASAGTIKRTGSHSASSSTSSANLLRGVKRAADTPVKRPPSAFSGVGAGAGTGSAGVGTGVGGSGTGLRLAVGARSLEIDLKSLHLHLATRVAETMACAEAMWEWVCREQMRAMDASATVTPLRRAIEKPVDPQLMAIRTLTRADFDACVARFGMDMHDNTALGYALEHHLGATPVPAGIGSSRSHERLSFDAACAQWDAVVAEQQAGDVQTGDDAGGADSQHTASDFGAASITRRLSRSIRIFHGVKE